MLNVCIAASLEAGRTIAAMREAAGGVQGLIIEEKGALEHKSGAQDFVTEADKKAQYVILSYLRTAFGKALNIVAEEGSMDYQLYYPNGFPRLPWIPIEGAGRALPGLGAVLPEGLPGKPRHEGYLAGVDPARLCVFIDPLDATNEFVRGATDCVMTLVGIALDGQPVGGVCYQPFLGETGTLTWGLVGAGTNLPVSRPAKVGGYAVTMSKTNSALLDHVCAKLQPVTQLRAGGSGFKSLQVIQGNCNVQVAGKGVKLWDLCAPHAILRTLGGALTDIFGREISYTMMSDVSVHSVVATLDCPVEHQQIIKLIAYETDI